MNLIFVLQHAVRANKPCLMVNQNILGIPSKVASVEVVDPSLMHNSDSIIKAVDIVQGKDSYI